MNYINANSFYEIQDYQFKKQIGKGKLSTVWLVYKKSEDKFFAAKVLDKKNSSNDLLKYFYNEISLISSLYHKNIVSYHFFQIFQFFPFFLLF